VSPGAVGGQAEAGGPAALPHAGGFAHAQVVLVDAEGDRGDQVLGVAFLFGADTPQEVLTWLGDKGIEGAVVFRVPVDMGCHGM